MRFTTELFNGFEYRMVILPMNDKLGADRRTFVDVALGKNNAK
jgi:hypothetical protein